MKIKFTNETGWMYVEVPFAAIACEAKFGPKKQDYQFIPLIGVAPVVNFHVKGGGKTIYSGTNREAAQSAQREFNQIRDTIARPAGFNLAHMSEDDPELPVDQFQVVRIGDNDQLAVRAGEDKTPRLLLLAGFDTERRGDVQLLAEHTTCQVLVTCYAKSNLAASRNVAALLDVGQQLTFLITGSNAKVVQYTWENGDLKAVEYRAVEWEYLHSTLSKDQDVAIL